MVQYVVAESTWEVDSELGVYKLQTCPTGYYNISADGEWDKHTCEPCAEGTECVLSTCTECTDCAAGKYKDLTGTHGCSDCPRDTYNPTTKAKTRANCIDCFQGSGTMELYGQSSLDSCVCPPQTSVSYTHLRAHET